MVTRKAIIVLSFILILVFAFQFMPFNSSDVNGANKHAESSKTAIFATSHHSTPAILTQSIKKPIFKIPTSKLHFLYEVYFFILLSFIQISKSKEYIINFRKKINIILTNHFHGTKYKEGAFIV